MTPTQAQIEAARLSEENLHSIGHARYLVEKATPDNPEVCFDYEVVADLLIIIDRLTAAAEVGEHWSETQDKATLARMIREAAIERCAQLAENYIQKEGEDTRNAIAAAIRALKEDH